MAVNAGDERRRKAGHQEEKLDSGLPSTYTIELEINLLDFDPKCPKNPRTLGERIRKVRMDRHMMVKALAEHVGVVPEPVTNWEKRNLKPTRRHLERLREVLGLDGEVMGLDQSDRQSQS